MHFLHIQFECAKHKTELANICADAKTRNREKIPAIISTQEFENGGAVAAADNRGHLCPV
jgi:hypothetical protein